MNTANGRTPAAMQDAMIEEMRTLFKGKKYNGQPVYKLNEDGTRMLDEKKKPIIDYTLKQLNVYRQDLPIPEQDDDDVDTAAAVAPWIIVRQTSTRIEGITEPQHVNLALMICAYDEGREREGFRDVQNIIEVIMQHFSKGNTFGPAFTVLHPLQSAMQEDDTSPYYFGAVNLVVTTPAVTRDETVGGLI